MDADMQAAFSEIKAELIAIRGIIGSGPAAAGAPEVPPAGFVFVKPTGVLGAGKVRLWPAVLAPQNGVTEGPWGYAYRLADMTPPLFERGRAMMVGQYMTARNLSMPEACDFLTHPQDWKTQAEMDAEAAAALRDAGAPWVSGS